MKSSNPSFLYRRGGSYKLVIAAIGISLAAAAYFISQWKKDDPEPESGPSTTTVTTLVNSENLILELTVELKKLNQSVISGDLPGNKGKSLFAQTVNVLDINDDENTINNFGSIETISFERGVDAAQEVDLNSLKIWQPALQEIQSGSFRDASFKIVRGNFTNHDANSDSPDSQAFETFVKFDGLAQRKSGTWVWIHALQNIDWEKQDGTWKIVGWTQESFETAERKQLMFRDVFAEALPEEQHEPLLTSLNDEFTLQMSRGEKLDLPFPELRKFFSPDTMMAHPSVSVVDINGDGWDDLYVMTRWRKNRMFINNQDGTFVEAAESLGLSWDRTSCAVFADFDNDGDKDAFLGRCFASSKLLINEVGKFVDRTEELIPTQLPGFVTSISAADFDNDGLLDLYLSTHMVIRRGTQNIEQTSKFMPPRDARRVIAMANRASPSDMWLNRPGPPNRLLKNRGNGEFIESQAMPEVWSNTFQATWADYDEDGDVDLYLCNDFAPDFLYRNDCEKGFVDVTETAGGESMRGYGMGATWGDYNNDGHQDLYVSNMYSKAGKRIINQLPDIDRNFWLSANGNRLFKNENGDQFKLVSGEGPEDQHVTKAGWSWGGQFCDFDNDGFLDLYVTSGFYTAPKEIACDEDL